MKKTTLNIILFITCALSMIACGKDNYDSPDSTLTGNVTYNGASQGVRGTNNSVRLQLWQDGYALREPIDVFLTQDGTFSAALFDGAYKLITVSGNGPWAHSTDTLDIQVKGNTHVDFPVAPYFTISDTDYSLQGNTLTVRFQLDQIDESRALEEVSLLVNNTTFVDLGNFKAKTTSTEEKPGLVSLSLDVTDQLASSSALFTRVAVKANGITEAIYDTKVEKIK